MVYPISLNVKGELCLVVGGGPVALRKARALARAGARVRAVSPEFVPGFRTLRVKLHKRRFSPRDLTGAALAISATDDPKVNRAVYRACRSRRIPVNVVDQPELCTFFAPAVVRRGAVTIAISTAGQSPSLAKALRRRIEDSIPRGVGRLARSLGKARRRILESTPPSPKRLRLLRSLLG